MKITDNAHKVASMILSNPQAPASAGYEAGYQMAQDAYRALFSSDNKLLNPIGGGFHKSATSDKITEIIESYMGGFDAIKMPRPSKPIPLW